jgi:hypothetical protein
MGADSLKGGIESDISEHRLAARRDGLRYESDLTDAEWALIEPMIPPPRRGDRMIQVLRGHTKNNGHSAGLCHRQPKGPMQIGGHTPSSGTTKATSDASSARWTNQSQRRCTSSFFAARPIVIRFQTSQ